MTAAKSLHDQCIDLHALANALAAEEVDRRIGAGECVRDILTAVEPRAEPGGRTACVQAYARQWLALVYLHPEMLGQYQDRLEGQAHD